MLRRFDAVVLSKIEVSRGRLHVLILPLDRHPRMERPITTNVSTSNLRPMQLGEILDASFNIFRRHFGLFLRLAVILVCIPTAFTVYLQMSIGGNPTEIMALFEEHIVSALLIGLVWFVVVATSSLLLLAGTIRVISDSYLGQEPKLGAALRFGAAKIIPLMLVALSKWLLTLLISIFGGVVVVAAFFVGRFLGEGFAVLLAAAAFITLVWVVIYVLCGYGVTTPVVVLEDLPSSFEAFGRSWDLTRGGKLKVFGTAAVMWLIAKMVPQMVVAGFNVAMGGGDTLQPVLAVVASVAAIILAPLLPCALTLLYYDLRVRREAFDLQILSEQLGLR